MANDKTPMEYMVGFFEGLFEVIFEAAKKVTQVAWTALKNRRKTTAVNVNGVAIPRMMAEEMAQDDMDVSRKEFSKWTKQQQENYRKTWASYTDEQKMQKREIFAAGAYPKLQEKAKEYMKISNGAYPYTNPYSKPMLDQIEDKEHVKFSGLPPKDRTPGSYKAVKQDEIQKELKEEKPEVRQKNELENNKFDGKEAVEKELKADDIAKNNNVANKVSQSFTGRRNNFSIQNQEDLNKEVNSLNDSGFQYDPKQYASNDVVNGKYNNLVPDHPIEYGKVGSKSASNEVSNGKYQNLAIDDVAHEEWRSKVEKGAQQRKENIAEKKKQESLKIESSKDKAINNNEAMIPNK